MSFRKFITESVSTNTKKEHIEDHVFNGKDGAKETVDPEQEIVPTIVVTSCLTVNVASIKVDGSIGMLKVAVIILSTATPVARFAGSVETTKGKTPVAKDQT